MTYSRDFSSHGGVDGAVAPVPSANEVMEALKRVVASPDFPASERNRRFLQRVVTNSLKGEKTRASEVAVEVFGRPGPFDSTQDPIVRIEAAKLRRDLETYYLKGGKYDRVRITMPKGRYFARFSYVSAGLPAGAPCAGHLVLLRAALLGMRGADAEAYQAWVSVLQEFPDFHFNPQAHDVLGMICGQDSRVRELLLEGLRCAANANAATARIA